MRPLVPLALLALLAAAPALAAGETRVLVETDRDAYPTLPESPPVVVRFRNVGTTTVDLPGSGALLVWSGDARVHEAPGSHALVPVPPGGVVEATWDRATDCDARATRNPSCAAGTALPGEYEAQWFYYPPTGGVKSETATFTLRLT